jgi:hypothetical protein
MNGALTDRALPLGRSAATGYHGRVVKLATEGSIMVS